MVKKRLWDYPQFFTQFQALPFSCDKKFFLKMRSISLLRLLFPQCGEIPTNHDP